MDKIAISTTEISDDYENNKYDEKIVVYNQCFSHEEYVIPSLEPITTIIDDREQYNNNKDSLVRSELYTKHSNADLTIDGVFL